MRKTLREVSSRQQKSNPFILMELKSNSLKANDTVLPIMFISIKEIQLATLHLLEAELTVPMRIFRQEERY